MNTGDYLANWLNLPIRDTSDWRNEFDDRQRKEIEFATIYARNFHHGAIGHNNMMIIAKMAALLDEARDIIVQYEQKYGATSDEGQP